MLAVQRRARVHPVLLPDLGPEKGTVPRRRGRYSIATRALAVAAIVVTPAIFYVSQRTQAARIGYAILQLRKDVAILQRDNGRLLATATQLRSLDRVERIATKELGMRPRGAGQVTSIAVKPAIATSPTPAPPTVWARVSGWLGLSEAEAREPTH